MKSIANYINGELRAGRSGDLLDNIEPATGAVYAQLPDSGADDVGDAVRAAEAAFPAWSHTPAEKRSQILLRIAESIERNLEPLAVAESIDTGKPISLARTMDIPRAAANFRFSPRPFSTIAVICT
jgi:aminomuconate-semialdehyde/2-hydroxymuconate-6-semialdehyde dehydrogenase